jgi:hypothetical protein
MSILNVKERCAVAYAYNSNSAVHVSCPDAKSVKSGLEDRIDEDLDCWWKDLLARAESTLGVCGCGGSCLLCAATSADDISRGIMCRKRSARETQLGVQT